MFWISPSMLGLMALEGVHSWLGALLVYLVTFGLNMFLLCWHRVDWRFNLTRELSNPNKSVWTRPLWSAMPLYPGVLKAISQKSVEDPFPCESYGV